MSFIDLLLKRRSIRKFSGEVLSNEVIKALCEVALLSPSSRGKQPWEIVVVRDKGMLSELAKAKVGAGLIEGADTAFVVGGRTSESDVWVEDCSILCSNLLLAAQDLGLGACWVQIRNRDTHQNLSASDYVCQLLNISSDIAVEAIVAVGVAAEKKSSHTIAELDFSKIHREMF